MSSAVGHDRRLNRSLMRALLDHVPVMVTLKDRDGRYLFANKAFRDEHCIGMAELRGHTDVDLFPYAEAMAIRAADTDAVAADGDVQTESRTQSPDGTRVLRALRFPVLDADGLVWAVGCISADITATRKAELEALEFRQELSHMDRVAQLDTISASLAHELMQPLTAILSNAQAGLRLLEAPSTSTEEIREVLADVTADAKRASQVVRTLREMTCRTEPPQECVDLSGSVREILKMMNADMALKGIVCGQALAPGCIATASKPEIQQVLLNLLLNAIHAVELQPPGCRRVDVLVGVDQSGQIEVSVRDSGPGIAASETSRLFDPFYTTKRDGMGIGLAVCRAIIEGHHGRIWAEPNELDSGTTFRFTLPASD